MRQPATTQHRTAGPQSDSSKYKSHFISNVSHELDAVLRPFRRATAVSHMNLESPGDDPRVAVLVVDDNDSKPLALKSALIPLGLVIVEADSGLAALRCVMDQDFAVILLDCACRRRTDTRRRRSSVGAISRP
jgi:PleD family two-component response regulator